MIFPPVSGPKDNHQHQLKVQAVRRWVETSLETSFWKLVWNQKRLRTKEEAQITFEWLFAIIVLQMKTMWMWRTSLKLEIKIITTTWSLIVKNNIFQQNPSNTIEIKGHTFSFVAYKVTIILWAYMKHQHRKKKAEIMKGKYVCHNNVTWETV